MTALEESQPDAFKPVRTVPQKRKNLVSNWCGTDVSHLSVDGPLSELPDESTYDGQRSNLARLKAFKQQNLSIREVARKLSNAGAVSMVAGRPRDIADEMEAWFKGGACDGLNLMFPMLPEEWLNFTEQVVPELQRIGVAQRGYRNGTLRD